MQFVVMHATFMFLCSNFGSRAAYCSYPYLYMYMCVCSGFSNIAGESYGAGARCVLQGNAWQASGTIQIFTATNFGAGCYQVMSNL